MSDMHTLALRQADQARTNFAAIESDLEVIQKQLTPLPTRRELAGTGLGIIIATAALVTVPTPSRVLAKLVPDHLNGHHFLSRREGR